MTLETEHFTVKYDKNDFSVAENFAKTAENVINKLIKSFNFTQLQKYEIVICGSVEEFIKQTGKTTEEYQSWMVGNSNAESKRVCVLSPAFPESCKDELNKVAVHELVHLLFDENLGVVENEGWVSEGIAILLAGQTDLQYVSESDFPTVAQIAGICIGGETPNNFADNGGYDYAGIYVWFFIKKFGFDTFLNAYKNQIDANFLIFDGFERQAISAYIKEFKGD